MFSIADGNYFWNLSRCFYTFFFFFLSKMLYEWDVLISFYIVSNLCSVEPSLFISMAIITDYICSLLHYLVLFMFLLTHATILILMLRRRLIILNPKDTCLTRNAKCVSCRQGPAAWLAIWTFSVSSY